MDKQYQSLWLENQLCFPLYAASRLIAQLYTPVLDKLDITYPQYLVLLVLWKENDKSVSEISKLLFLESNTITPLLKRMEVKGLIKRVRSEKDERKVIISLTQKGSDLREQAVCIPDTIINKMSVEEVKPEEALAFKDNLTKLVAHLAGELHRS